MVAQFSLTRRVVDRFVAGENRDDAIGVVCALRERGLCATVGYVGEDVSDAAQAAAVRDDYVGLLGGLADRGLSSVAEVSVKLSALGLHLSDGESLALQNARAICAAARAAGTTVTLDTEAHADINGTLRILTTLRDEFPWLGAVLQSMVYRAEKDCRELAASDSRVRLVKGAYRESASVAAQRKSEVDGAYARMLRILMDANGYPMVATHDARLIRIAQDAARTAGRTPDDHEYQMLYGVRTDLQSELARSGERVRVYVPYGAAWYGYFMRRLAERPANLVFFVKAIFRY
jgi:proline dehydrogenase